MILPMIFQLLCDLRKVFNDETVLKATRKPVHLVVKVLNNVCIIHESDDHGPLNNQ